MTSLFENNQAAESICVYILGENLSQDSISRLRNLAKDYAVNGKKRELVFVDTSSLVERMKLLGMPTYRGSYAANMRLFIENLFVACDSVAVSDDIPARLLYLDADTIVTGSLDELFASNESCGCASNPGNDSPNTFGTVGMVYDTLANHHKYAIGLSEEDGYFNSGVILYDVKKWIDGDYTGKIIDHVKNIRAQYPSPDQDLINVVLRGEITPLPFKYNYQPHLKDYSYRTYMKCFGTRPFYKEDEVCGDNPPVILHAFRYLGEFPWHKGNLHPFNSEFDKYLKLSPWKDYVKEESGAGLVMQAEKVMYKVLPKGVFLRIFKIMHARFYRKADKLSKSGVISGKM